MVVVIDSVVATVIVRIIIAPVIAAEAAADVATVARAALRIESGAVRCAAVGAAVEHSAVLRTRRLDATRESSNEGGNGKRVVKGLHFHGKG